MALRTRLRTPSPRLRWWTVGMLVLWSALLAPPALAHRSASAAHLGNIALLLRRKLHWDPRREAFVNDPYATRMLSRARRGPWQL